MRGSTRLISIACAVALIAACGSKLSNAQVASATYSVPQTIDDLTARANIVLRGTLLSEPAIKQIEVTPAEPGERPTESM